MFAFLYEKDIPFNDIYFHHSGNSFLFQATGCANIIPPTGGPRDSLPPVLVSAVPKDSTLNFNTNKIVLTFDEYVQLDNNITENLVVSPNPDNAPLVENKLKTVTVQA
jgi:hypothetical protein